MPASEPEREREREGGQAADWKRAVASDTGGRAGCSRASVSAPCSPADK